MSTRMMNGAKIALIVCLWLAGSGMQALAGIANPDHVYVTREGWEPDKGASAWMILRFVDPQARFLQVPDGAPLPEGAPFDVPESKFRRTPRFSTFESIRRAHALDDERLVRMSRIIHDLEINTWGPPVVPESSKVREVVRMLRREAAGGVVPMECGIVLFDHVYASLRTGNWQWSENDVWGRCDRNMDGRNKRKFSQDDEQ